MNKISFQISRRAFSFTVLLLLLPSCSVKPIYYDKEQAVAERGVSGFHKLYSAENYEGIYNLIDEDMRRAQNKDALLASMKQTHERWGEVQSTKLDRAKVFPGSVSEVRMAYHTKYEKGDGIEWFIWKVNGNEARLIQYQNFPANAQTSPEK